MNLVVVGLSHHSAPVEVRERIAFPADEIEPALRRAAEVAKGDGAAGEAILVSTCNRVELYLAAPDGAAASLKQRIAGLLESERKIDHLAPHLYEHTGDAALQHVFRVAASLDSAVIGESQILGQVKDAYERAVQVGTVGQVLGQVMPRAFAAAKRVRTETTIARSSASVASVAVDLGKRIFGELTGREVLVLGAGEMGELAARHLIAAGCGKLLVANRTLARAEDLCQRMREAGGTAEAHPWDALPQLLVRADLVVSSTGAAEPVLRRDMVKTAMKARRFRHLCIIDIAVPRDVEPEVGKLENVYLHDVDGLSRIVSENLAERRKEADAAERIVAEEIARCQASWKALGVVPTIRALRDRFTTVAHAEAQRTLGKLQGLSEKQQREVLMLADSIVNKLLHPPVVALKRDVDGEGLVEAVQVLFDLREVAPASAPLLAMPDAAHRGEAKNKLHAVDTRAAKAAAGEESA